jgi:hypothetical protein
MPRYKDLHTLKREMKVKDKAFILDNTVEEAAKFVAEHYDTTDEAALEYVSYFKGQSGGSEESSGKGKGMDLWHKKYDDELGEERFADQEPEEHKESKKKKKSKK